MQPPTAFGVGVNMGANDNQPSQSFVKSYPRSKIIYVKIDGTMDLATNESIARECADIAKSNGPWIGIADLCTMTGFESKGTGIWQEAFKSIKPNIGCVYLATTSTPIRLVTHAWGFFVDKPIHTFDTMDALVDKARTSLYLPEDILLRRPLPFKPRIATR